MREWIQAAMLAAVLVGGAIWAIAQSDALRTPWRVDREAPSPMSSSPVPAQSRAVVSVPASIAPAVPLSAPESMDSLRARCVNEVRGVGVHTSACEDFDAAVRRQPVQHAQNRPMPLPMITRPQLQQPQGTAAPYGEEPGQYCGSLYRKGSIDYRQCRARTKDGLDKDCATLTNKLEWVTGAERDSVRETQRRQCYWASVYRTVEP